MQSSTAGLSHGKGILYLSFFKDILDFVEINKQVCYLREVFQKISAYFWRMYKVDINPILHLEEFVTDILSTALLPTYPVAFAGSYSLATRIGRMHPPSIVRSYVTMRYVENYMNLNLKKHRIHQAMNRLQGYLESEVKGNRYCSEYWEFLEEHDALGCVEELVNEILLSLFSLI